MHTAGTPESNSALDFNMRMVVIALLRSDFPCKAAGAADGLSDPRTGGMRSMVATQQVVTLPIVLQAHIGSEEAVIFSELAVVGATLGQRATRRLVICDHRAGARFAISP